jgi:hypothetical protein
MTTAVRARIRVLACWTGIFIAFAAPAAQQRDTPVRTAATGTGVIAGIVTSEDAAAPAPVRRAVVTVTGTGISTSIQAVTDDAGRFAVTELPPGRFTLTVEKPGFVKTWYGSRQLTRPPGMPIVLGANQQVADLRLPLVRGAVLAGRVVDESGHPIPVAQVIVGAVTYVNGARRSGQVTGGSTFTADERGVFRAFGLPPGEYVIRAGGGGSSLGGALRPVTPSEIDVAAAMMAAGKPVPAPPPNPPAVARLATYFPDTPDLQAAQTIRLAPGEERTGIIITMRSGRVSRASGTAYGPDGQPVTNMAVGIANVTTNALFTSIGGLRADQNGRFTVNNLTPGRWLLFGRAAPPNTPSDGVYPWFAELEFVASESNQDGLVLSFAPGSTLHGRLVFNGAAARPDLSRMRISLVHVARVTGSELPPVSATPAPDGSFTVAPIPPGRFRVNVTGGGAWSPASAAHGTAEALDALIDITPGRDAPLTITLTDRPTELSGQLLDQLGRPAPEYSVLVFSADRAHWGTSPRRASGVVRLDSDGRYQIRGLPSGDYVLCVVTDIAPAMLQDPAFLEQLAAAGVKLTLADGERKIQDLKIGK